MRFIPWGELVKTNWKLAREMQDEADSNMRLVKEREAEGRHNYPVRISTDAIRGKFDQEQVTRYLKHKFRQVHAIGYRPEFYAIGQQLPITFDLLFSYDRIPGGYKKCDDSDLKSRRMMYISWPNGHHNKNEKEYQAAVEETLAAMIGALRNDSILLILIPSAFMPERNGDQAYSYDKSDKYNIYRQHFFDALRAKQTQLNQKNIHIIVHAMDIEHVPADRDFTAILNEQQNGQQNLHIAPEGTDILLHYDSLKKRFKNVVAMITAHPTHVVGNGVKSGIDSAKFAFEELITRMGPLPLILSPDQNPEFASALQAAADSLASQPKSDSPSSHTAGSPPAPVVRPDASSTVEGPAVYTIDRSEALESGDPDSFGHNDRSAASYWCCCWKRREGDASQPDAATLRQRLLPSGSELRL